MIGDEENDVVVIYMKRFWRRQIEVIIAEGMILVLDYYNNLMSAWMLWLTVAVVIVQFPIAYLYEKHKISKSKN